MTKEAEQNIERAERSVKGLWRKIKLFGMRRKQKKV
jgi:hypothetical protein